MQVLLNSFGDKRDITSHIQSLFYIKQGKLNLNEYYHKVKAIDTAIKTSAGHMKEYKSSTDAVNKLISLMTLTRYIDGLNGEHLSMFVRSYKPQSLEEAHDVSIQHSNAAFRQKIDNRQVPSTSKNHESRNYFEKSKFEPKPNQSNKSDKFRAQRKLDEDVSMRTYQSKMQVHNHEAQEKEPRIEQPPEGDNSLLDSEDDEYFEGDELNFLLAIEEKQKN